MRRFLRTYTDASLFPPFEKFAGLFHGFIVQGSFFSLNLAVAQPRQISSWWMKKPLKAVGQQQLDKDGRTLSRSNGLPR